MQLSTISINSGDKSHACDWVVGKLLARVRIIPKMNSFRTRARSVPAHREQQTGDHESERDCVVPRPQLGHQFRAVGAWLPTAASWKTISHTNPISISPMNSATNHTLDGPTLTFTGVRLTALTVKSFFCGPWTWA